MKLLFIFTLFFASSVSAQLIESTPGLYFKTGGDSQDQWYQILNTAEDQYAVTDIYGRGMTTDFQGNEYTINPDDGHIDFNGNAQTQPFKLNRVIDTDATFPLVLDQAAIDQGFSPNILFAGDWNIVERDIDPMTGQAKPLFGGGFEFIDVFTLSVHDKALRFNDSNGTYFQGRSDGVDSIIFRSIKNFAVPQPVGPYQTIPGSRNNFPRDVLGYAKFTDINHFEVLLPLQNYTVTPMKQFMLQISGERVDPLPRGDVNGDRSVDDIDRALIFNDIGMLKANQGFNIASDLNSDGVIDYRDIAEFDGETIESLNVTSSMTGQWYDPRHNGEGWDLQILDENRANLSWYTYDFEGNQMWLVGVGKVKGNEIIFEEMAISKTGTTFGSEFNPDEIEIVNWGSVRFYFNSCNQAGMSYNSILGFGHGGLKPIRLTRHAGLICEDDIEDVDEISPFTGLWYDPSHNGEGWAIQVREDNQASISWYTYDQNGDLMWMVGVGEIINNTLTIPELAVTRDGVFGSEFDPTQVVRELWGSLNFTLDGCHQGTLSYQAVNPLFNTGTLQPVRLASTHALVCIE